MPNLHRFLPVFIAASAGLAQADALSADEMFVVKPAGSAETAVHKPGRIAWCEGTFTGEAWDKGRTLRALRSSMDFQPDSTWEKGVEHMCQWADDPTWQRQATYVVQTAMNYDTDKDQDGVVARIKRLIVASQKERGNAGREPTDEERLGFDAMHLQPVAPGRGVETATITGAVPWCDGVKLAEKWDTGRIARNAGTGESVPESALHLCQRPNDATWKLKAGQLLQTWMNWTKQSQADAIASLRVRGNVEKLAKDQEALCPQLVPDGTLGGANKAYAIAKQKFFGCYDRRYGETWQGNLHFQGDETGYYIDASDSVDSEIARLYWLFAATGSPRTDLPANNASDNKQLLAYAVVAGDFANLDDKAAASELSRAPFAGNDYARIVVSESIAVLRWRKKMFDAATEKLVATDPVYVAILRDAAKEAHAGWGKLVAPWKSELDRALAFEKKFGQSRAAAKGCSKDFEGVVEKLIKSYKSKEYSELLGKIADDPIAALLLSRISLCYAVDGVSGSGMLSDLAGKSRAARGRRTYAYYAILDKLTDALKDRRLLVEVANFYNPVSGGASDRAAASDLRMTGNVPLDPNRVESRGVVGKVTKSGDGIRVEFKKVSRMEAQIECKQTNRIDRIDWNGNITYRSNCWQTGKMVKVDLTPAPQDVPARFATGIKAGVFAAIDRGGDVPYVKAKADDKTIVAFLGYAL